MLLSQLQLKYSYLNPFCQSPDMSVLCITMTTDVLISFHVCGISQTASTSIMIVAAATAGRMSKGLLSVTQIHEESAKATCGIRIIPRLIANTSFTVLFILIIAYHRANKPMSMYMHAIREMTVNIATVFLEAMIETSKINTRIKPTNPLLISYLLSI